MWIKFLRRFFRVIHSEKGQGVLEYMLVVVVVAGLAIVFVKPLFKKYGAGLSKTLNSGMFKDDGSGSAFYQYSVK